LSKKIAIIPARGGSKRIPRKNIKEFHGKPIIAYSIETAIKTGLFDEVMVSTDDVEIAEIAKSYGATVPFLRNTELSNDIATTASVLINVLDEYKKLGSTYDYVCCIYPCAPFLTKERLIKSMVLLEESNTDSVIPVVKYSYPPQRGLVIQNDEAFMMQPENYDVRSQDLESIYHDAGQFYCIKVKSLYSQKKLFCKKSLPVILSKSDVQDIDTYEDWREAEIKYQILKEKDANILKYILGTVQFGLKYGINNETEMPTQEQVFSMLSYAYDCNIKCLDTASGYGVSEEIIGKFTKETGKRFDICTKYSGKGNLLLELENSLSKLNIERVYLYYLHKYDDCKNEAILSELRECKKKGVIEKIGISIYTPDELRFIIENMSDVIDVVQIPFSIFDCTRWINITKLAQESGIEVFCRSIFLQGVLFMKQNDDFIVTYNASRHIEYVQELCKKYNTTIENLAFSFCKCFSQLTGILFGCDTVEQLKNNIDTINNQIHIKYQDIEDIITSMSDINMKLIDPREWSK
jgi:N-acylneuraminate cytidylyltransferase